MRPTPALLPVLAGLGLLCTACATVAPQPKGPTSFLYRTRMPDQPGTVYIVGSVRLAPERATLDQSVADAVIAADNLVYPVDPDATSELVAWMRTHGPQPAGRTLADDLRPATLEDLKAFATRHELSVERLMRMRPWLASVTISLALIRKQGYDPAYRVQQLVARLGKHDKTRTRTNHALEPPTRQAESLGDFEKDHADILLLDSLRAVDGKQVELFERMYLAGRDADFDDHLRDLRREDLEYAALHEVLINERNLELARATVPFYRRNETTLVTVGAVHVVGRDGLVAVLGRMGATVERILKRGPIPKALQAALQPPAKAYVVEENGFAIDVRGKVEHSTQQVRVGRDMVPLDIYVYEPTARTTLAITVMTLPEVQSSGPAQMTTMAQDTLTRLGLEPTQTGPRQVAGQTAYFASGRGAAKAGDCTVLVVGRRIYTILASADAADGDPRGMAAARAVLSSFRLLRGGAG